MRFYARREYMPVGRIFASREAAGIVAAATRIMPPKAAECTRSVLPRMGQTFHEMESFKGGLAAGRMPPKAAERPRSGKRI